MTAGDQWGGMLLVTRQAADAYAARFLRPAGFIEFSGARDPKLPDASRRRFGAIAVSLCSPCGEHRMSQMIRAGSPVTGGGCQRPVSARLNGQAERIRAVARTREVSAPSD